MKKYQIGVVYPTIPNSQHTIEIEAENDKDALERAFKFVSERVACFFSVEILSVEGEEPKDLNHHFYRNR